MAFKEINKSDKSIIHSKVLGVYIPDIQCQSFGTDVRLVKPRIKLRHSSSHAVRVLCIAIDLV